MGKAVCMGELLIDFQSKGTGSLKDTSEFVRNAGGAPANVCVQAAKLGLDGVYLSKVGDDSFGDFLVDTLKGEGVDVSFIGRDPDRDTSLAFVSLIESGDRQFAFYRKTAADLNLDASDYADVNFGKGDVFEFGTVALKTAKARAAHDSLIGRARASGALVCFDPNLRFNLWENGEELKAVALEYAKKADIVKLGEDELTFLAKGGNTDAAAADFMRFSGAEMLALTRGDRGAKLYLKDGRTFDFGGCKVKAVDTTGAGDSFFGALIAELSRLGITKDNLSKAHDYAAALEFACRCAAYSTTRHGAIPSFGTRVEISRSVG